MELTRVFSREELEMLIKNWDISAPSRRIAKELATALLAEMDKPRIQSAWIDAPGWASRAWIQWQNESGTHMEWREKPYTRELPKSPEREIAERVAYKHSIVPGSREQLERIALDAINEYKESVK